jgi:(2Fe-2S) ferredoxin
MNGKKCCFGGGATPLTAYAKKKLQLMEKHGKGKFRVSSAGCLGRCSEGPSMVIYPDEVWYRIESEQDIDDIINAHLLDGKLVSRLLMPPLNGK